MTFWNPNLSTRDLPTLSDHLKHHLRADGFCTIESLEACTKEQLRGLGYDEKTIKQIRAALKKHRNFVEVIGAIFNTEGLEPRQVKDFWPFDLLNLPFTSAQLGYILRWQKDIARRYGEKERFCVVDGQVFYCTRCPYRDERSNFCGWCTRKILADRKSKGA
jgi:hypothetical protein